MCYVFYHAFSFYHALLLRGQSKGTREDMRKRKELQQKELMGRHISILAGLKKYYPRSFVQHTNTEREVEIETETRGRERRERDRDRDRDRQRERERERER